jgi:hypothetical protein
LSSIPFMVSESVSYAIYMLENAVVPPVGGRLRQYSMLIKVGRVVYE